MQYQSVHLAAIGTSLPSEIVTTAELEARLGPLYERLKLPEGRLELMTGIRERRFFPAGVLPGTVSVESCRNAIAAAGIPVPEIGCLIHASVCRDHLEPATACSVHHRLGLSAECQVMDLSNACLGILNGALLIANLIELGQIRAGLVVGSENGRGLVETTVRTLNEDHSLTRHSIKDSIASLTIGSASCAWLLTHRDLAPRAARLKGGAVRAHSRWNDLCQSQHDLAGGGFQPLMATDSHELMVRGVETGVATFDQFLAACQWNRDSIERTVCHQVGIAHQKMMLESLGLDPQRDHSTFPWLGNTGSAALPVTLGDASAKAILPPDTRVGLLGIGSGINCVMLGLDWGTVPTRETVFDGG